MECNINISGYFRQATIEPSGRTGEAITIAVDGGPIQTIPIESIADVIRSSILQSSIPGSISD